MPGPFDYPTGVGRFAGVGKFESLAGVDVGAGLRERLTGRAERLCFLNDADAFAIGEYRAGAARGHQRVVCLTLGTGWGRRSCPRAAPSTPARRYRPADTCTV